MNEERLYIKVVLPDQGIVKRKPAGGDKPEPFKPVTAQLRDRLGRGLAIAEQALVSAPSSSRVIPLRVLVEQKALAKSHWRDAVFNAHTCPIIGAGKPGELYAKVTGPGLTALKRKIANGDSPQALKEISAIRQLRPLNEDDRLSGVAADTVFKEAHEVHGRRAIKVGLFDYGNEEETSAAVSAFEYFVQSHRLSALPHPQYSGQKIYTVACRSNQEVRRLASFAMVRSVGIVPTFRPVRQAQFNTRPAPDWLLRVQENAPAFPIIGVVDSGITATIPSLENWIYMRERFVAQAEENTSHGTFVAGLLVWGHYLNSDHTEIGDHPCRILDVHVLPNADPTYGPVGMVTEAELLQSLEQCLIRHSNEVKVWNLSLSSDQLCTLDKFSDFAIQLDNLQERFGVTFVIAAGNYESVPLLPYPRHEADALAGRITSPADSVLGITVGSISHIDHPSSGTRRGEPSPFTRHGPGPNYVIKPDLAHFGGNMARDHAYPLGITSISAGPNLVEDMGTSFATPLVSRQLAYVHHRITPMPSSTLARAILTHNARDIRTNSRVRDGDDHYIGFGTPLEIDRALECSPWMMTLVFEETLRPGYFLEWDNFPYPESLGSGGKFRGEIWMTLAYPPARNPSWGSEYCETHVDAHFGVYRDGKKGETFKGQVPLEHNHPGELYESFQVRALRKWAPVRTYHNEFTKGITGKRWRLYVELLCRHKADQTGLRRQPFALVLTIADPERAAPVYDEMTRNLRTRFQIQNLSLRPTVRVHR